MPTINSTQSLVLVNRQNGVVIIPAATPLTRLNYFDGKFLRAQDLKLEQDYLRQLVRESNQAGGPGVAHGYDLTEGAGDTLNIGPGLAIDPQGRVLLLPQPFSVGVQELIDKSRDLQRLFGKSSVSGNADFADCELTNQDPPVDLHQAGDLFLIVVSAAEAFCGEEDVYGKLCEEACVTSTDRPYIIEGVTIRAIPLPLRTMLPNSRARSLTQTHLRSRVASAYFEDERKRIASLISGFGLHQQTWCLGADGAGGSWVAIGVLARAGSQTVFLDPWIARRERIDPPARRYWQCRMMMRPWDVFLAQVLQFQCQLHDLYLHTPEPGKEVDPCGGARGVINEAATTIADLRQFYESTTQRFTALNVNLEEAITFQGGLTRFTDISQKLISVSQTLGQLPPDEFLLTHGVVEVPSAGYLPVTTVESATVNQQVRRLMGGGVDLRFCVVRPDYVAHALEEAQHMERISLVQGLDDPNNKPQVDVLVPNGEIIEQKQFSPGRGFEATVNLNEGLFASEGFSLFERQAQPQSRSFRGAGRIELLPSGSGAFYLSCEEHLNLFDFPNFNVRMVETGAQPAPRTIEFVETGPRVPGAMIAVPPRRTSGVWVSLSCDRNVFQMKAGDKTQISGSLIAGVPTDKVPVVEVDLNASFRVTGAATTTGNSQTVRGQIQNAVLVVVGPLFGAPSRKPVVVDLDVEITLRDGTAIEIVLTHQENAIRLSADWNQQTVRASVSIGLADAVLANRVGNFVVPLAWATLKQNDDVLSGSNPNHIEAIDALRVVGTALQDPTFAEPNGRLLFPPPAKPIDELLVRGTLDWVMFHRRRTRKCSVEVIQPPPPPPRRYAVVAVHLEDVGQLDSIRAALHDSSTAGDELIHRIGFRLVDVVEFDAGAATLVSSPISIQQDWQAKSPGNLLEYGAIASNAAVGEGQAIAQSRLGRIEQIVSSTSHPVPNAVFEVLSTIPHPLVLPDTDGTIVMVTVQDIATVCHTVYRAENDTRLDAARTSIRAGNIGSALKVLTSLGNVQFQRDQPVVSDAQSLTDVVKKWTDQSGSAEHSVICFAASTTTEEQTRFKAETKLIRNAIRKAMGETPLEPEPGVETTTAELPTQCPTFSIITVKTVPSVCHSVYRAKIQNQFERAVKDLQSITGGKIQDNVVVPTELIHLPDALFEDQSANVFGDGKSMNDVNDAWNKAGGGKVAGIALVYQLPGQDEQSRRDQAKAIGARLGQAAISDSQMVVVRVPATVELPTGCPAFTIVLPQVQVQTVCMSVYRTTIASSFSNALDAISQLRNGADINADVIVRNKLDPANSAQFEANTINVVGNSMNTVLDEWNARGGGKVVQIALVSRRPTSAEEDKGLRDQATSIATNIGSASGAPPSLTPVPVDNSLIFPTPCRAFVIILASGQ